MRIYSDLAPWFHLLTGLADHEEEASYYMRVIEAASEGSARTLLELGSGGGNNASHMKTRFPLTDLSAEMLGLSRTIKRTIAPISRVDVRARPLATRASKSTSP